MNKLQIGAPPSINIVSPIGGLMADRIDRRNLAQIMLL